MVVLESAVIIVLELPCKSNYRMPLAREYRNGPRDRLPHAFALLP